MALSRAMFSGILPPRPWREPPASCADCHGTGWVYDSGANGVVARCPCRQLPLEERQKRAGIPQLERRARFELVRPELRQRAAGLQRFLDGLERRETAARSLLFTGPVGTGKTWLAACAANWALIRGWSVAWRKATEWLAAIRDSYDPESHSSESGVNRPLRRARLLVLNDLGAERLTPWVESQVEDLLDDRISGEQTTIVTSNLTHEEIAEAYGARTASRLGPRFYRLVPFTGPDFRMGG